MIGLIEMIRAQARAEYRVFSDDWLPVSRAQLRVGATTRTFPISRYYYRLLDACPLRMPSPPQHTGDSNG